MTQKQRDDLLISLVTEFNDFKKETRENFREIKAEIKEIKEKLEENTRRIEENTKRIEENTKRIEENTRMIEENAKGIQENLTQIKEIKNHLFKLEKFTYDNFEGVRIVFQDYPEYVNKKMNAYEKRIENNEIEIRKIKEKLA